MSAASWGYLFDLLAFQHVPLIVPFGLVSYCYVSILFGFAPLVPFELTLEMFDGTGRLRLERMLPIDEVVAGRKRTLAAAGRRRR